MAQDIEIRVIADTSKAVKGVDDLNKGIKNTGETAKQTGTDISGISNVADKATGGAVSKFNGLKGVISGVSKGFGTLKGAIISTGIGALVIVIGSLISAFSASEEGQNKFAKILGVVGSVVGNVTDLISDLGELIIGVFSGDSDAIKAITNFGKKIFDVVGLPIKNTITTAKTLAKTLGALFSGDISKAFDELENGVKEIGNNFKDTKNAINDGATALKNFGQEALREAEIASQIANQRAKADKTDRDLIVKRAEANRTVADLREKALDREKFTTSQRISFLEQASKVEQDITNKEIQSAILRRNAIIEENKLFKSNKEALQAEEEAKAKVIDLETKRLNAQKAITSQISSLKQQENAIAKQASTERIAKATEENKRIKEEDDKAEKDRLDSLEKIRVAEIDTEAERRAEEKRAVEQQYLELKTLAEKYGQDTTELENARLTKLKEVQDKFDAEDKAKLLAEQEAKIAKLQLDKENEVLSFEEQRELIKAREEELTNDKLLTDEQRTTLEKQYSDARIAIAKAESDAKKKNIDALGNVLNQASALAGENTKVGKGLAVASATINTYRGVSDALAAVTITPFETALKFANAAAIGASGIMNVKKILSVKVPNVSSGGGSAPSISLPSGGVSAPKFNIVGGNTANQLADTLDNRPTRAYVVANDVTTAQSLDRNIISNASIGG